MRSLPALLVALACLAATLPLRAEARETLAITAARIFTTPGAPVIEDGVVVVEGDRIVAVGPRASISVPANARAIDAAGASVVAGFWNSHIHLTRPVLLTAAQQTDAALQNELQADFTRWGFTTVFDLASTSDIAAEVRNRIASGRVHGPRLLSVGDPFYPPNATPIYAREFYEAFGLPSAEITTVTEAAARADRQLAAGGDGLKLFTGSIVGGPREVAYMEAEAVRALTDVAHRHHRLAFAHPTDQAGLEVAVRNGVDVLAHAAPLMGEWSPDYARWVASTGAALIPTLALYEEAANPRTPAATAIQQTRAFAGAGGAVLFGTDAGFTDAFDTSAELRLLEQAVGWRGVLAALTTAPAARFGESETRGQVAEGYIADLVIVDGDPRDAIQALAIVRTVIRDGQVIYTRP
ncbi:amidohydrolase family protein [Brevundimonas sp. Leaf363]|uniref:amidohydrolase family protein n=1 Tax=Brevundimonas sp. Leaf363 TaxID=1736353 RepID=UPI000AF2D984|nr:amidohydrolase family protein [Brevundimonas sp. Leaf363]